MALRVCTEAVAMGGIAEDLRIECGCLLDTLRSHLFPAVARLREVESANAAALLAEVGVVAGTLDAVTGKLFRLSLSRGARLRQAASVRGKDEVLALVKEMTACKAAVAELRLNVNVNLAMENMKLTTEIKEQAEGAERDNQSRALTDAKEWLAVPPVSGPVVAHWDDAHADRPWCRLLQVVLGDPAPSAAGTCVRVVSTYGMGGVGKTTVAQLVAARVAAEGDRYPDGVYWVSLGQGATRELATKYMAAVATCLTQQQVTLAPSIDTAAARLRDALADKSVVLFVDDCWDDELARHFVSAVGRCRRSCLIFTTRLDLIARHSTPGCIVSVGTVQQHCATDMLLAYALHYGSRQKPSHESEKHALAELVQAAAGLPLALAVLGSLVRADGWANAANQLDEALSLEQFHPGGSLWACFMASYGQLCVDGAEDDLYARLYKALCVVDKQEWLPLPALAALWGMEVGVAARHLRIIARHSLATVREEARTVVVGLHDLIVDWVRGRLVPQTVDRQIHHAALVNNYGSRLGIEQQPVIGEGYAIRCRPWWNLPANSDGYMEHALCRHLHAGGPRLREELLSLLLEWNWIAWRVVRHGNATVGYRADCRVSGMPLAMRVAAVVDGALAAADALGYPPAQVVAFDLAARLPSISPDTTVARARLRRLVDAARTSQDSMTLRLLWPEPLPLPQELAFLIGHRSSVTCSCKLQSADGRTLLVSGSFDCTLRVWDVDSGECVRVLEGHEGWVTCVCVVDVVGDGGEDGGGAAVQRVVSGSYDKTLRVWDVVAGPAYAPEAVALVHLPSVACRFEVVDDHSGRLFAICWSGAVFFVDLSSGPRSCPVACSLRVASLCVIDADRVAVGCRDGTVRMARLGA